MQPSGVVLGTGGEREPGSPSWLPVESSVLSADAPGGVVPRSARDHEILRSLARRINARDAGAHSNLGVVFYQKGLIEEAIAAFERALELDPTMQVAERNLQVAYFHTGYFDRLVAELRDRLRQDTLDRSARHRLARAYLHTGDIAGALAEWRWLLEHGSADLDLYLNLAAGEYRRGRAEAALSYLERAQGEVPDEPWVQLRRGEIYYRQGRHLEARNALERAVEIDPELAEAHHLLAFVYGDLGDDALAVRAASRASELNPSYEKAEANLSLDRYSSARYDELIGARGAQPAPAEGMLAHYNLGLTFRQKGLYEEAWREFALALERGEDALLVGQARAELQLLRGAAAEAESLLAELLELEPESPKLWNERGVAAHQRGDLGVAEEYYGRALRLDPTYVLARNNLGVLQHHLGDAASESTFRLALGGGRGLVEIWRNLGLLLARQGRRAEAVTSYRRALEVDPGSAAAWTGLGAVLLDGGRLPEARAAFVRAVDLDPTLAEARYQLAFALSASGDYRGALRETRLALELDPYVPTPRFRLLIDLQFEEATLLAPELDVAEGVQEPGEVDRFDFRSEELDDLFAELAGGVGGIAGVPGVETPGASEVVDLKRVREVLSRGQFDRAAALAQEAVQGGADRAESLVLLGEAFLRRQLAGESLERYQGALAELRESGRSGSLYEEALLGATRALLLLGRVAEARGLAEELCELAPGDATYLQLLGQALARAGQFDRAVEVLSRARDLAESDLEIATDLGVVYLEIGELVVAEEVLHGVLARDPLAVAARSALGRVLEEGGREEEAGAEYRRVLEVLPSFGEVVLALGELECRRGRYEVALEVQVDLLTLDPYHLDVLCQLGRVLLAAGRREDAEFAFRRVLRLDPDHEGARLGVESATREVVEV